MEEIPEFRVRLEPVGADARAVLGFAAAADEVGHRHQLGGRPTWLQDDQTPTCRDCGERMTFYGQLDSIGDDISLADVGMVYVFVCFNDFEARAILQSG
ncbi:hypothetical protein DVA67_032745 [Solirubrobacter sp. CPCC 204708]|uniref:DUF1963 domain-containing protein n=1 Tax=Solirubrobacter deserti TaxID=2282478 RepID=A0ABT4RTH7_9ACTN|nr:hypothetical protein [Solirubrobacter deserti]MBE2320774.1 hypothetical protein [Solirubrobacter deserti]MDA0141877.1 hypothetical protein [Solirubrobacter deserti]